MTLQQLQALDVSLCYASIMDTLEDTHTPYALKIAYVPFLTPTEIECELDPKRIRPIGDPACCGNDDPSAFEASFLLCAKGTLWQWMKNHQSSHLNADVLSSIRWFWMGTNDGKDQFFESSVPIATDLSTPKTRAFPFDCIFFRIYPKPTQKED